MPNQIAKHLKKIVYNEDREIIDNLLLLAKRRRCTLSDIMRQAALDVVEKHADLIELQRMKDAAAAPTKAPRKK